VDNLTIQGPDDLERTTYVLVNLAYRPFRRMDIGAEYTWGERRNKDGQKGRATRLLLGLNFGFWAGSPNERGSRDQVKLWSQGSSGGRLETRHRGGLSPPRPSRREVPLCSSGLLHSKDSVNAIFGRACVTRPPRLGFAGDVHRGGARGQSGTVLRQGRPGG
jgi:hypothetical protein